MELQVSTFYTPANFTKFQEEFKKSVNCACLKVAKDDNVVTYEVFLHASQNRKFLVDFYMKERRSTCSYKKFSSEGMSSMMFTATPIEKLVSWIRCGHTEDDANKFK